VDERLRARRARLGGRRRDRQSRQFTHVGKYQGRVAAANIAGATSSPTTAPFPRAVFTDPQVASVGDTSGENAVVGKVGVDKVSRTSTFQDPKRPGFLKLFADPERKVVVGAVAVGPEAGEWIGQITLAIRAEVPVATLRDTIQPVPDLLRGRLFRRTRARLVKSPQNDQRRRPGRHSPALQPLRRPGPRPARGDRRPGQRAELRDRRAHPQARHERVGFYVILDGEATVTLGGEELNRLRQGDFFGEISTLLDEPLTADVTAETPVRVLEIPGPSSRPFSSAIPGDAADARHGGATVAGSPRVRS
jgi:mannose-6-phosphate isomerase-like protein (cupin superfamily)